MKILIITDAWRPQINGVVRTYEYIIPELEAAGHEIRVIGPHDFPWRMPMPGYREIELSLFPYRRLARQIKAFRPDTIHIATEGPLGAAARRYCRGHGLPFNTAYHTHFPDYLAKRIARYIPFLFRPARALARRWICAFHAPASGVMVATTGLREELECLRFKTPFYIVTRGVLTDIFTPSGTRAVDNLPRPVALYVGRIAIEKNIEAFLRMDWPGSKLVVGDGPARALLEKNFPDAHFAGKQTGPALAAHFRSADIFVFPSKTDTFGMVITEALACGLPVAAYPVTGPRDIITDPVLGALDDDLATAARQALTTPGTAQDRHDHTCRHYTWTVVAQQFLDMCAATAIPRA